MIVATKKQSRIQLEIDLLRYPVYNVYYKDTLKRKIQENIKEHYYEK